MNMLAMRATILLWDHWLVRDGKMLKVNLIVMQISKQGTQISKDTLKGNLQCNFSCVQVKASWPALSPLCGTRRVSL